MNGSLVKWIAGVVGTGLVSMLAFFAKADRDHVQRTAASALEQSVTNDRTLAIIQEELRGIRDDMRELKEGQARIERSLQKRQ